MGTQLQAGFVFSAVEDGIVTVGFADHEFDTQEYLLLQRDLSPTDQDMRLRHQSSHLKRMVSVSTAMIGFGILALFALARLLPVGAIRGGMWMLRGPIGEEERDFLYWFTRTMYPLWAGVGACLVIYGPFFS